MCGITGLLSFYPTFNNDQLRLITEKMTRVLTHRGPDDEGIWTDERAGISLGHRRLSIIDLSASGHQPMFSSDKRYVIALNGEIYNFQDIRKQLISNNYSFHGHSDTEVVVNAIQHWGIDEALIKFVGMFALAVWDRDKRSLYLARDRLGEKPLYYGWINSGLVFASELKAIKAHPDWQAEIDRNSLALLLKYTYIPSPYCIYKEIKKLEPGNILEISFPLVKKELEPRTYWSVDSIVQKAVNTKRKNKNIDDVSSELDALLKTTIKDKMISDVPLGAFLSGGIDSSTIVALMQSQSSSPIKTFSIGFHETEYNEATFAKEVAQYLGTDHTELYITPEETRSVIPRLPDIYDEPFSDSSQIPTFLISELARRDVTVALSGDGGDELFGGYTRYMVGMELWNQIAKIPAPVREISSKIITRIPQHLIDKLYQPLSYTLPRKYHYKQVGSKLHKLAHNWNSSNLNSIYYNLISLWQNSEEIVYGSNTIDIFSKRKSVLNKIDHFSEWMMFTDTVSYLPDDILVKVDRASMAVSLEVRVPFLDHRIFEFIWNQAPELKIANGEGKHLLRQVLYRYVPKRLLDRPKMGFGVPVDHWLRGPLREWAGDLLSFNRIKSEGFLNPEPVMEKWNEHLSGKNSWHYQLWPILMFQAWYERWMS